MPVIIDVKCANCGAPLWMEVAYSTPTKPSGLPVRDEEGRWFCPGAPMENRNCRREYHARIEVRKERL